MAFDPKLFRWLNTIGFVVVASLVAFVGFVSWRINDASYTRSVVPGLAEFRGCVQRARLAATDNRLREAEEEYTAALRLYPRSSSVNLEFAKFYEDHGQMGKAAEKYERVVGPAIRAVQTHRTSSVDMRTLVHFGDLCLRSGNVSRAQAIFDATSNGAGSTGASLNDLRAVSYARVGRYVEAIKLNPRLWEAYRTASLSRSPTERNGWLGRFARLVRRYPDDLSGQSSYADTLWALGRPEEAVAYLQNASRNFSGRNRDPFKEQIERIRNQIHMEARLKAGDIGAAGAKLPPGSGFAGPGGLSGMPAGMPGLPGGPPRR